MQITVKLYGAFRLSHPDYDDQKGLTLEMPGGAQIKDLLFRLGISSAHGAVAMVGFRLVSLEYPLKTGEEVKVMQLAAGG